MSVAGVALDTAEPTGRVLQQGVYRLPRAVQPVEVATAAMGDCQAAGVTADTVSPFVRHLSADLVPTNAWRAIDIYDVPWVEMAADVDV